MTVGWVGCWGGAWARRFLADVVTVQNKGSWVLNHSRLDGVVWLWAIPFPGFYTWTDLGLTVEIFHLSSRGLLFGVTTIPILLLFGLFVPFHEDSRLGVCKHNETTWFLTRQVFCAGARGDDAAILTVQALVQGQRFLWASLLNARAVLLQNWQRYMRSHPFASADIAVALHVLTCRVRPWRQQSLLQAAAESRQISRACNSVSLMTSAPKGKDSSQKTLRYHLFLGSGGCAAISFLLQKDILCSALVPWLMYYY